MRFWLAVPRRRLSPFNTGSNARRLTSALHKRNVAFISPRVRSAAQCHGGAIGDFMRLERSKKRAIEKILLGGLPRTQSQPKERRFLAAPAQLDSRLSSLY